MMNKVCMITQSPYPNDPRVRREAEVLAKAGYDVDILCILLEGETETESFGRITAYRIIPDRRPESISAYMLQSVSFFITAFIKLQALSKNRQYAVIQIHNMPESHVFTALLQKIKGVPVLLDIHDLTPELFEAKWTGIKQKLFLSVIKMAEKLSCRFANHIITVTEKCKEILISRGVPADKITLILNTPDQDIFKYDTDRKYERIEKNVRLIYHGTVAERFGVHLAVEAMALINKEIPCSVFNVYGKYDESYKIYLIQRIKELGLEESVKLNGRFIIEDIYEFIKESDVGIVPYLNNAYMNLALSTKTFEYAAAGIPIVATKLDALYITFGEGTLKYAEAESAESLARNVIALCKNPDERKELSLNARYALNDISWEVMSGKYLSLVNSLAGRTVSHKPVKRRLKRDTVL